MGRKELDMTEAFSAGGCPMSEVRGRSREDPMPERREPREVTPCLRSGVSAERSYPASEVRGRRSNPTSKEWWLGRRRRA